ncbi:MAG: hypothetical protein AAGD05_03770, partial [Bacteroidota bacterium]
MNPLFAYAFHLLKQKFSISFKMVLFSAGLAVGLAPAHSQPVNDFCSGAIPIVPNPEGTACAETTTYLLPFTTDGTTDSGVPTVCTNPKRDQWFIWTATTNALIFNTLSPGQPGIAIFADCADASSGYDIDCASTPTDSTLLKGWEVGDQLIIQIYHKSFSNSDVAFCLREYTIPPPPVNDICSGAIPIVPSPPGTGCEEPVFLLPFEYDGTTDSDLPDACLAEGNDQWFTWTATTTSLVFQSASPGFPGITIFGSCADAQVGNEIDCIFSGPSTMLSGWSIGDELIIQIHDWSNAQSNVAFCLQTLGTTPNDICSTAIPIVPSPENTPCTNSNFYLPFAFDGTTDSGVPSVCSPSGNDQWFSWTATTTHLRFHSQTPGSPGIAIFSNCANAQAGIEVDCANVSAHHESLRGWEIGDELIIQIYDEESSFSDVSFCLEAYEPPPNDLCSGAIPIQPSPNEAGCDEASFILPFATDNTTDSGVPDVCSISGKDQWFSWTATEAGLLFRSRSPGRPGIAIIANCTAAQAGDAIACANPGDTFERPSGWAVGDELLIQIYDDLNGTSDVAFCLETYTPPPNNYCVGATPILPHPVGTSCDADHRFSLPFNVDGTTDSGVPSVCSTSGKDQWFSWTATETHLLFRSQNPGNPGIAVFANCTAAEMGIDIDCANAADTYEALSGWELGEELLIQIYDFDQHHSRVAFCLEAFTPPPNDSCSGAIPILPFPAETGCQDHTVFTLPFSTDGTLDSGVPEACGLTGKDQWFSWTATARGLFYTRSSLGHPNMAVFANCTDAEAGSPIACTYSASEYELSGWEIGEELLIQIYDISYSTSDVAFCLETFNPPPNDLCSGAIPIQPSPSETGCNGANFILPFATDHTLDSGVPNTCSNSGKDQWFSWTATTNGLLFDSKWPGYPGVTIFANCGDALTGNEISCADPHEGPVVLTGWEVGDEILIQIYDEGLGTSNVGFCLETIAILPPPVNDFCSGAIPLLPSPPGTACTTTSTFSLPFFTDGTTDSGVPRVCSFSGRDQWFTWTATELGLIFSAQSPGFPGIAVYASCADADTGIDIDCADVGADDQRLQGWEVGDELLIQIYDNTNHHSDVAFCLAAFSPPPNDFCSGAIPINPSPPGTSCLDEGTFELPFASDFTTDSEVFSGCLPSGKDQWFSWTASTDALIFDSTLPGEPGMAVFASCADAEAGIAITCTHVGSGPVILQGWTVGDEILIQIYDFLTITSDVAFCLETFTIPTPPVNDYCIGATPIVPSPTGTGCTSDAQFTLPFFFDGTTDSGVPSVCLNSGNDQWFTWTATERGLIFQSRSPGNPGI